MIITPDNFAHILHLIATTKNAREEGILLRLNNRVDICHRVSLEDGYEPNRSALTHRRRAELLGWKQPDDAEVVEVYSSDVKRLVVKTLGSRSLGIQVNKVQRDTTIRLLQEFGKPQAIEVFDSRSY